MKALICELCGSNDLVKQDGYYVCQHCGTKFTPEEAKKMLVELSGTITVKNPIVVEGMAQADSLCENGINTYKQGNFTESYRLFSDALSIKPNHPKASLYRGLSAAYQSTVANPRYDELCESAALALVNAKNDYSTQDYLTFFEDAVIQLASITILIKALFDGYTQKLNDQIPVFSIAESVVKQNTLEQANKQTSMLKLQAFLSFSKVFNAIKEVVSEKLDYPEKACIGLISFLEEGTNFLPGSKHPLRGFTADGIKERLDILSNLSIDDSKPEAMAKEKEIVSELLMSNEVSDSDTWKRFSDWTEKYNLSMPEKKPVETKTKSDGCYVATAVYGSYDCPQVWTLRRYRDSVLAKNWFGLLFIKVYYLISPTLVKCFGKKTWFRNMWKPKLDRMVKRLNDKGFKDTPYDDLSW